MENEKLNEMKDGVKAAMSDRDDAIKSLRDGGLTLATIAEKYGLTRSRVQQIVMCGPPKPSYVYRCYDDCGVLLYVGCTQNPTERDASHWYQTKWFDESVAIIYERYPCLEDGRNAERLAIVSENPMRNIDHSTDKSRRIKRIYKTVEHFPKKIADIVDWPSLMGDMMARGYSMTWIASELDVAPATIRALRDGRNLQPQYPTGVALVALHKKIMRRGKCIK